VGDLLVQAPQALDRHTASEFSRTALAAVERRAALAPGGRLIVDLAGTTRVDTSGLDALVLLQQRASEHRLTVCLRGASEELRFMLVLTRLDDRFELEPPVA
jgi:anti-anti-sigma regulatory factor